ncbi:hypothetical protein [Brucella thiophenivorans]|uniref:Uncharacterized protein n=1 Tax=Brucella thiophenivorans TaxID=571255 RepID=A0A256G2D5_9HYPH|nr:hypothetical protein [Brucella thiophenivorans]OYR21232.1 hypothetical protein CEV31_0854 [Brucella thiophenivorans]
MGRPKLNMTPDEYANHITNGANLRKKKQRRKQAEEKAAKGHLSDTEIEELIQTLLSMPLSEASLFLAKLQRSYKKEYGIEIPGLKEASFAGYVSDQEAPEAFNRRHSRARRLSLIRMFAATAIARSKKRVRDEKYSLKEALEAARLKMDVKTYKESKRAAKKSMSKKEEIATIRKRIGKNSTATSGVAPTDV